MKKETVKTRRRRFLALCMALVMTLGLLPLNALAASYPASSLKTGTSVSVSDLSVDDILSAGITISGTTSPAKNIAVQYGKYHGAEYTSLASSGYDVPDAESHTVRTGGEFTDTNLANTYWRVYSINSTGNPIVIQLVDTYRVSLKSQDAVYDSGNRDLFIDYEDTAFPNDLPTPTREGYIFLGWLDSVNKVWTPTSGNEVQSDLTLTAGWAKLSGGPVDCGTALVGYTPDSYVQNVTVTYDDGNVPVHLWRVSLEDEGGNFLIAYDTEVLNEHGYFRTSPALASGSTSNPFCTVKPKAGLAPGTYNAEIEVTLARKFADDHLDVLNTKFIIPVTFTVTANRSVKVNAGDHITMATGSGAANQTVVDGSPITDVKYTADAGYHFPSDYAASIATTGDPVSAAVNAADAVKGFKLALNSDGTQLTVSGAPTADTTVTLPDATPNTYKVRFNGNGGSFEGTNGPGLQHFVYDVAQELNANPFTAPGDRVVTYEYNGATGGNDKASGAAQASFTGWAESADGDVKYTNKQSVKNLTDVDNDVVDLYAKWAYGAVTLPTPTRENAKFGGWYSDEKFSTKVGDAGDSYEPAASCTLYARWTPIEYDVRFNANGGSFEGANGPRPQHFVYDVAQELNDNPFTAPGDRVVTYEYNGATGGNDKASDAAQASFAGWAESADGDVKYTDKQSVKNLTDVDNDVVDLYAKWAYGAVTLPTPTREDAEFEGWYSDEELGTKVGDAGDSYEPAASCTLYANWSDIYTVTVTDDGNGTGSADPEKGAKGTEVTLSAQANDGYVFDKWVVVSGGVTVTNNKFTIGEADVEIRATFTPDPEASYTVRFNANGGTGTMQDMLIPCGQALNLPLNAFANGNLQFAGWSKDKNASYADWLNGAKFSEQSAKPGDVVTLYAVWAEGLYDIVANLYSYYNGATELELWRGATMLASYDEATIIGANADEKREGGAQYTFKGVQSGIYNLVVTENVKLVQIDENNFKLMDWGANVIGEKHTLKKTTAVIILDASVTSTVHLPLYEADSALEIDPALPPLVIAGVDRLTENKYAVPDRSVEVTMTAEKTQDDALLSSATEDLGNVNAAETYVIELTLEKIETLYKTGAVTGPDTLTETEPYYLEIVLPIENTDADSFAVYRRHNVGGVDTVDKIPQASGGRMDVYADEVAQECFVYEDGMLYVYLCRFSTLAIACGKTAQPGPGPEPGPAPQPAPQPKPDLRKYKITVVESEGGLVVSDHTEASVGDTVTLTVSAYTGYALESLTVVGSNGEKVKLSSITGGCQFFMPSCDVTVRASFRALPESGTGTGSTDCPRDNTCPMAAYSDLDRWAWYHDGIHFMLENGLMQGFGNGIFQPNGTTTRAQLATILWNMEGKKVVNYLLTYSDVAQGEWYTEAIRYVTAEGLMDGYGNGTFGPNDPITREQLVTILYRCAQRRGVDMSMDTASVIVGYDDASSVSDWATLAMAWAVETGTLRGRTATTLEPTATATRAEIATIFLRFCMLMNL